MREHVTPVWVGRNSYRLLRDSIRRRKQEREKNKACKKTCREHFFIEFDALKYKFRVIILRSWLSSSMGRTYGGARCSTSPRLVFHPSETICKIPDEWLLWQCMALLKGETTCAAPLLMLPYQVPGLRLKTLWNKLLCCGSAAEFADIEPTESLCSAAFLLAYWFLQVELLLLLYLWTLVLVPQMLSP